MPVVVHVTGPDTQNCGVQQLQFFRKVYMPVVVKRPVPWSSLTEVVDKVVDVPVLVHVEGPDAQVASSCTDALAQGFTDSVPVLLSSVAQHPVSIANEAGQSSFRSCWLVC